MRRFFFISYLLLVSVALEGNSSTSKLLFLNFYQSIDSDNNRFNQDQLIFVNRAKQIEENITNEELKQDLLSIKKLLLKKSGLDYLAKSPIIEHIAFYYHQNGKEFEIKEDSNLSQLPFLITSLVLSNKRFKIGKLFNKLDIRSGVSFITDQELASSTNLLAKLPKKKLPKKQTSSNKLKKKMVATTSSFTTNNRVDTKFVRSSQGKTQSTSSSKSTQVGKAFSEKLPEPVVILFVSLFVLLLLAIGHKTIRFFVRYRASKRSPREEEDEEDEEEDEEDEEEEKKEEDHDDKK